MTELEIPLTEINSKEMRKYEADPSSENKDIADFEKFVVEKDSEIKNFRKKETRLKM